VILTLLHLKMPQAQGAFMMKSSIANLTVPLIRGSKTGTFKMMMSKLWMTASMDTIRKKKKPGMNYLSNYRTRRPLMKT